MPREPFSIDYTVRVAVAADGWTTSAMWQCRECDAEMPAAEVRRHTLTHRAEADR